ncbi:MAG: acyltransferase, partial [Pseudomonadota bacterium]
MTYRPELDGLRAVAVISVILFHAGVPGFRGGHVGVDVFFVLSGFLISGILLCELDEGRFSLIAFYERRIRRLLPAMVVLLLVTYVLAALTLTADEFARFGQTLIGVALFSANILFVGDGLFFQAAPENPLLHLWTLSLEEQVYLVLPFLFLLIWRVHVALVGFLGGGECAK